MTKWNFVYDKVDFVFDEALILKGFNISVEIIVRPPKFVRWNPPFRNYSINVDGASKGNPGICGGGGCIRNTNGDFVSSFAFFYGSRNSLLAETRALHDGLRLALERKINVSIVYSDSAMLVRAISMGQLPHWVVFPWWRGICSTLQILKPQLVHIFQFWPKANLASRSMDVCVVSASTIWTPTLSPAFSDMDVNFFDLHALQSPDFWEQASSPIGELSPTFWPKANLASRSMDVCVVSASTIWTPTLSPASSDVDANFSDLHALQSPDFREQASSPIGELSPTV
ncbi:hypothetical protein Taro_006859 [Colocasia esculenta]|uniref:RNase H type-1 domain-containing protein n=1 Tax=Colocasia esculenta TaxID=4460 RepID=A0A843TTV0_COLES|nr:hypothetical protein [Colocasia esculenta]